YDLDEINRLYLVSFVAEITGRSPSSIESYLKEIECDEGLKTHIRDVTRGNELGALADSNGKYGRRIGWYAIARAIKPAIVVETGVDKGLGACVLTAALKRNLEEGHEGFYYGVDIDPDAGYLLTGRYAERGSILYGDSLKLLEKMDGPIDLFINDSDHSAGYEAKEYDTISNKLSDRAVILGDNAHVTGVLLDFAWRTERQFLFYKEKPVNHWYPGAGIGAAFRKNVMS